jgi:hypothetical protein
MTMIGRTAIDAGICGFHTTVVAESPDERHVTFAIETECDVVARLVAALKERQPIDVYGEVDKRKESVILATVVETLAECRKSCAVPLGIFKAMQLVTGLALPKDVRIEVVADTSEAGS